MQSICNKLHPQYQTNVRNLLAAGKCLRNAILREYLRYGNDHVSRIAYGQYLTAQALEQGPKCVKPNRADIDTMRKMELPAVEKFSAPFDYVFFENPSVDEQLLLICFHRGVLSIVTFRDGRPFLEMTQAEGVISFAYVDKSSKAQFEYCISCLKMCIALTQQGFTAMPENVREYTYAKKMAGRGKAKQRANAKRYLAQPTQILSFKQSVVLRQADSKKIHTWPASSGTPKATHWRRGHWRCCAYGPGRTQRRRKFIPSVMVNRNKFVGKLSDATATYEFRNQKPK